MFSHVGFFFPFGVAGQGGWGSLYPLSNFPCFHGKIGAFSLIVGMKEMRFLFCVGWSSSLIHKLIHNPVSTAKTSKVASICIIPLFHLAFFTLYYWVHECHTGQQAKLLPGLEISKLLKCLDFFFLMKVFLQNIFSFSPPLISLASYILWICILCAGWHTWETQIGARFYKALLEIRFLPPPP